MAQRSLFRPDQLDSNGSYEFAQLVIDGYSGGDLEDGYLTGLIFQDRANGGATRLEIHADDGEINQTGSGKVTLTGNVEMKANAVVHGDFTVNGTTTYINTEQMLVTDPITTLNVSGTETLSSWTGLSERDTDGYNRTGWVFDGYWGLSTVFSTNSDVIPDRAIAYVGAGDAYGDLSSQEAGNSGADKIGVSHTGGLTYDTVQKALEELYADISDATNHTNSNNYTINYDATPAIDEDTCLIMRGGDGVSLMEGYMCLITDSVNGSRFEFKMFDDAAQYDRMVHLGPAGDTSDVDACLVLNAGDGAVATSAEICLDGTTDIFTIGATTIRLDGDIELGAGTDDCIAFNGVLCSDIIPCCDDAYDIGDSTHRFNDGYFTNLDVVTLNVTTIDTTTVTTDDLIVSGNTTLGDSSADCVIFNASICSDIMPCCDDAYQIGDTSHRWIDAYFTMPVFDNITPVGDVNSLIGVLEGIDDALSNISIHPERGVYEITNAEATLDILDSSRAADQGQTVDVSGYTDIQFRDNIFIYWNGQMLYNDPTSVVNKAAVQNDVSRQTGTLKNLIFSGNLKKKAIIQIVDMT